MRELPTYRLHLEEIYRRSGNKALLNVSECAEILGMERKWVSRNVPFHDKPKAITAVRLAQWLAEMDR